MSYQSVDLIEVRAWDRQVGAVIRDEKTGYFLFEYSDQWLLSGVELAPLSMPIAKGNFIFRGLDPLTYQKLPPMLADALPDRFGNALISAQLVRMGLRIDQITALDRLAYMGNRGMGALTFHPPTMEGGTASSAIQLADLVAAARASLSGEIGEDKLDSNALAQLIQVGTSAGGARPKAVIAYNTETKQYRSGQFEAPAGFEQWILKLDGVTKNSETNMGVIGDGAEYCRVEYAYYLMAKACGIDMTESEILPEGPRTHFLTKRFDRGPHGERIHMQSLCAMSKLDFNQVGTHAYEQYFQTIRELGMGTLELAEAFRRMVFNIAACNRDDHTKNFSFLLPENGNWKLAPAYDITHAHSLVSGWTLNHQMSVNGKFDAINLQDLRIVGDQQLIPGYRQIISEVFSIVDQWSDFAEKAALSGGTTKRIYEDMAKNRPS